jgi:hypothetical protein
MVANIAMTGIRSVKDYNLGSVNKNSVELHKDTMSRCWRTDDVCKIVVLRWNHRICLLQRCKIGSTKKRRHYGVWRQITNVYVLRHPVVWRVHGCCTPVYRRVRPLCMADSRTIPAFYNRAARRLWWLAIPEWTAMLSRCHQYSSYGNRY